jgi:outer membrane protein
MVVAAMAWMAAGNGYADDTVPAQAGGFHGGDILVRVRGIGVIPDVSGSVSPINGALAINNSFVPELDGTYFITDNVGVEAIAGVTPHDVTDVRSSVGTLGLGKVWLLPPTVTAQWHFIPDGQFNPYLGVGVNYTKFFDVGKTGANPAILKVKYGDSWGPAFQFGVDARIKGPWYMNFDVKKLLISSDVKISSVVGPVTAKANIDPWIVGVGVGYRF